MPTIAELTVDLNANVSRLRSDFAKAQRETEKFTGGVKRSFNQLKTVAGAIGLGLGLRELINFGRQSLNAAANIGELAKQLGVSASALQELQFAASQTGVAQGELETALGRLSISIGDAAGGAKTAQQAFADMGVSFVDVNGQARRGEDVFKDIAEAYKNAGDKGKFLSDMQDAMGRSANRLIPLIENGAAGLDDFAVKARALGLVLSDDFVRSADDAIDKLATIWEWLGKVAARATLKILIDFGVVDPLPMDKIKELAGKRDVLLTRLQGAGGPLQTPLAAGEKDNLLAEINRLNDEIQVLVRGQMPQTPPAAPGAPPVVTDTGGSKKKIKEDEASKVAEFVQQLREQNTVLQEEQILRAELEAVMQAENLAMEEGNLLTAAQVQEIRLLMAEKRALIAADEAAAEAARQLQEDVKKTAEEAKRRSDAMNDSFGNLAEGLGLAAAGVESWAEAFLSRIDDIANALIGLINLDTGGQGGLGGLIGGIISAAFSAGTGGISTGGIASGGTGDLYATGGHTSGGWGIVGEEGPELIGPGKSNTVIPNHRLGGMGGDTYIIDARGADQAGLARLERLLLAFNGSIERRAVNAVFNESRRGGSLAMARRFG